MMMAIMYKVQRGFSLVSAIFLLVVIAALGTFAVTLSTTQHQSAAMDVMGSRAYQAARAGIEWAAYHVSTKDPGVEWGGCTATSPAAQFAVNGLGGTLSPFAVDVYCTRMAVSEVGASPTNTIWIYDVSAVAKTGTPGGTDYVERVVSAKMGK